MVCLQLAAVASRWIQYPRVSLVQTLMRAGQRDTTGLADVPTMELSPQGLRIELNLLGIDDLPAHLEMLPARDRTRMIVMLRPVMLVSESAESSLTMDKPITSQPISLDLSGNARTRCSYAAHRPSDSGNPILYTDYAAATCAEYERLQPVGHSASPDSCALACSSVASCRHFSVDSSSCLAYNTCAMTSAEPTEKMRRATGAQYKLTDANASVTIGTAVHLESLYFGHSFLDIRGHGCEENEFCTSLTKDGARAAKSGRWRLARAGPSSCDGDAVCYGDQVYIQSDTPSPAFLDVRGVNCNGNKRCVSASALPRSKWVLSSPDGVVGQPVLFGDSIHVAAVEEWYCAVLNHHGRNTIFMCTPHLDARGMDCQGNPFCVSASGSSERDGLSGTWTLKPVICEASS